MNTRRELVKAVAVAPLFAVLPRDKAIRACRFISRHRLAPGEWKVINVELDGNMAHVTVQYSKPIERIIIKLESVNAGRDTQAHT